MSQKMTGGMRCCSPWWHFLASFDRSSRGLRRTVTIGDCQVRGHVCEYGRMRVNMLQFCYLYIKHGLSIVTCFLGGVGVVVAKKQAL